MTSKQNKLAAAVAPILHSLLWLPQMRSPWLLWVVPVVALALATVFASRLSLTFLLE